MAIRKYQQLSLKAPVPSTLPQSVDLRPKMSPVQDQEDLNSCTGFALVAAMEYLENVQRQAPISLSQLFVYYNERVLDNSVAQDSGALMSEGIASVMQYGACELSLWPYDEKRVLDKPDDAAYADGLKRRALSYTSLEQDQITIRTALINYPVVFGLMIYSSFESETVESTGMVPVPDPGTETLLGGHAMTIVGYDQAQQRFLVRNSWGTDWGIGGYCWIPYAYILNPALCDGFYTINKIEPYTVVP